jgi:hypothetical protein
MLCLTVSKHGMRKFCGSSPRALQGPYFLGEELSMVDVAFAPILERAAASLAYYKGLYIRGKGEFPGVEAWFDAMETRPASIATRSDYYTHSHCIPPQVGRVPLTTCIAIRTVGPVNIQPSASDFWGKQIHQTCARIPKKYLKRAYI